MFKTKTIRSICAVTLLATLVSIGLSNYQKSNPVKASNVPVFNPIATESITQNTGNISTPVASDMDENGNQVYVWGALNSGDSGYCATLYMQKFQMSGLPLTGITTIDSNCTTGHQYKNPSVSMDSRGDFVVAWMDIDPYSGFNRPKSAAFNAQSIQETLSPFSVDDDGSGSYIDAKVQVAINKNFSGSQIEYAVTWLGCDNRPDCNFSDRLEYRAQVVNIDLNNPGSILKSFPDNVILNPSPYESAGDSPSIAFANSNYLITWPGYNTTNNDANWAIFGQLLKSSGGFGGTIPFKLSNFSTKELDVNVTGLSRGSGTSSTGGCPTELPGCTRGGGGGIPIGGGPIGGSTSEVFYETFSTNYLSSNPDIYVEKIICAVDGTNTNCNTIDRPNGSSIFVRANTTTTDIESQPKIRAYTNPNDSSRTAGDEETAIDYLNVVWYSYNNDAAKGYIRSQNFKDNLARVGTESTISTQIEPTDFLTGSVAMDMDGNYSISSVSVDESKITNNIYQSMYQRAGAEALVHAPDSSKSQQNSKVALNSNGNYVVVFQNDTANNNSDIVFNLFDKYGNPIKTATANSDATPDNHLSPSVAFFNDESASSDYGKFIITWAQDSSSQGVYYQIFNADGTPSGGQITVNSGNDSGAYVSTGLFGQFVIVYNERNDLTEESIIKYLYQNSSNAITGEVTTAPSGNVGKAFVELNPIADGTTTLNGNSLFAVIWGTGDSYARREGFLTDSSTVDFDTIWTGTGAPYDMSGAYLPTLGEVTSPFMYVVATSNSDGFGAINAFGYDHSGIASINLGSNIPYPHVAVDKATGNILVDWQNFSNYSNLINSEQIIYFSKDSHTILSNNDHLIGESSGAEADVVGGDFENGYYYNLDNATAPFYIGEIVDITKQYSIAHAAEGYNIYFDHTGEFYFGETLTGQTSGASASINAIYPNFVHVAYNTGTQFQIGELIDNSPFFDTILDTERAYVVNFDQPDATFQVGDNFHDSSTGVDGTVRDFSSPFTNVAVDSNVEEQFIDGDTVLKLVQTSYFNPDSIGTIKEQFYRATFSSNSDSPITFSKFGPEFSPHRFFNYGQYLNNDSIDFDTRSSDMDGKLAINSYSISGDNSYLDTNGVLQQLLYDPFSIGSVQDLSPQTNQAVNPGGKYIIVPQLIDFGNLARSTTGTVNFEDLTMPDTSTPGYLQVTDLDGTDFDLTVSLTNLTNTSQPSDIIPNSNFIIENNDGINPNVTSNYSFTNTDDITLDPSTAPGQNANLSSSQTLLRKNNNNTGVWNIHPTVKLTIPGSASSGVYSGTITFTLI